MASSTITGVGSGFDTIGIVKALVDAEKAPKQTQITAQQKRRHDSVIRCGYGKGRA